MENENKNSTLLGTAITSLVGSLLAILGFVIPYSTYPNDSDHPGHTFLTNLIFYDGEYYHYLNVIESVIFTFLIIIAIVSILAIIGSLVPKLGFFSNIKTLGFTLALFILLPIYSPYEFFSSLLTVVSLLTSIASGVAYYSMIDPLNPNVYVFGAGFFLEVIGLAILLGAFLLAIIVIFSKKTDKDDIRQSSDTNSTAKKGFNITIAIMSIIGSIGFILGIALPYFRWFYRTPPGENRHASLMLPERSYFDGFDLLYQAYIDYAALFYLIVMLSILIAGVLLLLSSFNVLKMKPTKKPIFILIFIALIVPIYSPTNGIGMLWFPPFMEIINEIGWIFYQAKLNKLQYADLIIDEKRMLTFSGVFLYISIFIMLLVLALILSGFTMKKLRKRKTPSKVESYDENIVTEID